MCAQDFNGRAQPALNMSCSELRRHVNPLFSAGRDRATPSAARIGAPSALRGIRQLELQLPCTGAIALRVTPAPGSLRTIGNLKQKLFYRSDACTRGAEMRAMSYVVDDSQCAFG
jgi:hypothetical protein